MSTATEGVVDLFSLLGTATPLETFVDQLPKLPSVLPQDVSFEMKDWDVISWMTRPGNAKCRIVYFSAIRNQQLHNLAKTFILYKRLHLKASVTLVDMYVNVLKTLDKQLGMRDVSSLTNADFYRTEDLIREKSRTKESSDRAIKALAGFGEWLNWQVGIPISYEGQIGVVFRHGRKGSEFHRLNKLMSTSVIHDMVASRTRPDISDKDRFYLSVFLIFVATGFRVNELATLPKDCLLQENGNTSIRYFPEKKSKLATRFIAADMAPAVIESIKYITNVTEAGRDLVTKVQNADVIDWHAVLQDKAATEYFARKFAHTWTASQKNRLINPHGAWLEKEKRFIDAIGALQSCGSKSAAARSLGVSRNAFYGLLAAQQNALIGKLPPKIAGCGKENRTDWDTDARVISFPAFEKYTGVSNYGKRYYYGHVIEDAREHQLAGMIYPSPAMNDSFEKKYKIKVSPVIISKDGHSILDPKDALFISIRHELSSNNAIKPREYRLITDGQISRWLSGEKRSRGTGNHEDSCFVRLGIIDPKTGEFAKYTSHDVRHWLDTTYAEGKMDECTIALIFGRTPRANHTYDQTSKKQRLKNLREAIRDGKVLGSITENFSRIAAYSREEAEQYLLAYTLMVNLMPHGACTLNWGLEPCPNHMGCFSNNGDKTGTCDYFVFDKSNATEVAEMRRLQKNSLQALDVIPENSPQYSHHQGIYENVTALLDACIL